MVSAEVDTALADDDELAPVAASVACEAFLTAAAALEVAEDVLVAVLEPVDSTDACDAVEDVAALVWVVG